MKRRNLLAMAAAGMAASAQAAEPGKSAAKTYVLVHGAYHGGWCWKHVAALLRAAGHDVYVPTLTGLGEKAHLVSPAVNLSTHVADVASLIEAEELRDVILVGHSYAGHVVPLVADRLKSKLRHVVFVDAIMAVDGKPFIAPDVGAARAKTAIDGYLLAAPETPWFGVPADHPDAAWVKRHLTPHPLPTLMETVHFKNGGAAGLPKTFIRCLKRRPGDEAEVVAPLIKDKPEWTWLTIDTGHDVMVTEPRRFADMLLAIG